LEEAFSLPVIQYHDLVVTTDIDPASELAARAETAERMGLKDAHDLWEKLIARYPDHPRSKFKLGWRHLQEGDAVGALRLFAEAEAGDPRHADAALCVAIANRKLGQLNAALIALERALAIDPYFFMALLSKGAILEQIGRPRQAARVYANAIKIAPPGDQLPQHQRAALDRATAVVAENAARLAEHLRARTAAPRGTFPGAVLKRFDESLDILAGVKPRHVQDPLLFYFPQLPAIPFYERSHFPWLNTLEAATETIQGELQAILQEDRQGFEPYMQIPTGAPLNQWAELNHSRLWSTFHIWRNGTRVEDACKRCPKTAALLDRLPLAHQPGYGPTALFSVLSPRTRIPPHTGSTNIRLLVHLPLILPPGCAFRVGNETQPWRMNEAWVFDDTIEHEAWNDSDDDRVILIFDVWNPLLSVAERELCCEMMLALREYDAGLG
jgi:tetratricopeptide (TPR) repeat protein